MINSLRLPTRVSLILRAVLAVLVSLSILSLYPHIAYAAPDIAPPSARHSIRLLAEHPTNSEAPLWCFSLDAHYRGIEAALDMVDGALYVHLDPAYSQALWCHDFAPVDTESPHGLLRYTSIELSPETHTRYVFRLMLRLPGGGVVNMAQTGHEPACWSYNGSIGAYSAIVAPVLTMGGIMFIVLTPPWDIGLYCLSLPDGRPYPGLMPTWVEDHDPSGWDDPAILIINLAATHLVTLNRGATGRIAVTRVVAIGLYDTMYGGHEPFAVTIPFASDTPEGDGMRIWTTNAPAWASRLLVTYADDSTLTLPLMTASR